MNKEKNNNLFSDKVCVITGGASGIGKCIREEFEKEGANVYYMDIANMVLFLCSHKAGFITGENITIDGGQSKLMIYHEDCGWTYNPEK